MSASRIYIPSVLIIPRVHMKAQFLEGDPPGTMVATHKSDWMKLELFDHFSKINPVLIILDGH